MPLTFEDTDTLTLHAYFNEDGDLELRHGEVELANYGDGVLARSDSARIQVEVAAPSGWQLSATHELDDGSVVSWLPSTLGIAHAFAEPTTDPLEVSVNATDSAGTKKKKKVYVEAKPGGALPDRG